MVKFNFKKDPKFPEKLLNQNILVMCTLTHFVHPKYLLSFTKFLRAV